MLSADALLEDRVSGAPCSPDGLYAGIIDVKLIMNNAVGATARALTSIRNQAI